MAKRAATVAVIYIYTPPKPTIPSIEQGPKQRPIYSKKSGYNYKDLYRQLKVQ